MSNLFADLQIRPEEFLPVSHVDPTDRAKKQIVRVSVSAKQDGPKKAGPRLNITFSTAICETLGVSFKDKVAVLMGRNAGQVLVCSAPTAKGAFPGAVLPLYTVGASGGREGAALRKIGSPVPFWCVQERAEAADAKGFKLAGGALLIELPDSFVRPEYLTPPLEPTADVADVQLTSTAADAPALAEDGSEDAGLSTVTTDTVKEEPRAPEVSAAAPIAADGTDPEPAEPTSTPEPASQELPASPVAPEANPPGPSEEELFRQDAEALYGMLLGCARQGRECPPNSILCEALVEGTKLQSNYVTALYKHLQKEGRISFGFVDSRGKTFDTYTKGRVRVVELLMGSEKGLSTRNPYVGKAADAGPAKVAPPAPKELPKAAVKVRGLSDAECELQEALKATKSAADEDFDFLKSKGVAIARNAGNAGLPFTINGVAVSEGEVSRRARSMRLLTRKSA